MSDCKNNKRGGREEDKEKQTFSSQLDGKWTGSSHLCIFFPGEEKPAGMLEGPENLSWHQQKCEQQYLSRAGSCIFSYLTSSLTELKRAHTIADLSPSEKH